MVKCLKKKKDSPGSKVYRTKVVQQFLQEKITVIENNQTLSYLRI